MVSTITQKKIDNLSEELDRVLLSKIKKLSKEEYLELCNDIYFYRFKVLSHERLKITIETKQKLILKLESYEPL
jgi:hypothetical protein